MKKKTYNIEYSIVISNENIPYDITNIIGSFVNFHKFTPTCTFCSKAICKLDEHIFYERCFTYYHRKKYHCETCLEKRRIIY